MGGCPSRCPAFHPIAPLDIDKHNPAWEILQLPASLILWHIDALMAALPRTRPAPEIHPNKQTWSSCGPGIATRCQSDVCKCSVHGRSVSFRDDLAPCPSVPMDATKYLQADPSEIVEANAPILTTDALPDPEPCSPTPMRETRRSTREVKPPSRYGWWLVSSRIEDNDINFELKVSSDNSSRKEECRKTLSYNSSTTFLLGRKNDMNI